VKRGDFFRGVWLSPFAFIRGRETPPDTSTTIDAQRDAAPAQVAHDWRWQRLDELRHAYRRLADGRGVLPNDPYRMDWSWPQHPNGDRSSHRVDHGVFAVRRGRGGASPFPNREDHDFNGRGHHRREHGPRGQIHGHAHSRSHHGRAHQSIVGQEIEFDIVQDRRGSHPLTWDAAHSKEAWSDRGNTRGKRSTIRFYYDGTNWMQMGAQSPYI